MEREFTAHENVQAKPSLAAHELNVFTQQFYQCRDGSQVTRPQECHKTLDELGFVSNVTISHET